jgi:hypothetical protein
MAVETATCAAPAANHSVWVPGGIDFGMPEFCCERLDYEPPGKSANVVDTPEGAKHGKTPLQQGAGTGKWFW